MKVLISRDRIVEWTGEIDPQRRAKCLDFPVPSSTYDPWFEDYWEAMDICNGANGSPVCPVRARCLHRALINNERWGVWGGMLHMDRKRLKDLFPNDPEKWQWQPPTVKRPTPTPDVLIVKGRVASRAYLTPTAPLPS